MKFYGTPLSIDKEEETKMLHRVEMLKKTLSAKQTIHLTLVTTFGLVHGKHSGKVQKIITIDDFFYIRPFFCNEGYLIWLSEGLIYD